MIDERGNVEENSHVKQALNMKGYPDWLINSITTIQPSLERTTSVSSDEASDDARETKTDTTHNTTSRLTSSL